MCPITWDEWHAFRVSFDVVVRRSLTGVRHAVQVLKSAKYEVHYNSNRLGIRLMGPKPQFARPNGGDGGAHPSNVHDHVYPLGTVNFTGSILPLKLHCNLFAHACLNPSDCPKCCYRR